VIHQTVSLVSCLICAQPILGSRQLRYDWGVSFLCVAVCRLFGWRIGLVLLDGMGLHAAVCMGSVDCGFS
jgi:hypothetical protein